MKKNDESKDMLEFVWTLNHECNYMCPYCSLCFREKGEEINVFDRDTLYFSPDEWKKHWHRIYQKYGSVQIHIVGGEPMVYPSFFDIVAALSEEHYLGFDTNLSADIEGFIKKVPPSRISFGIGASFHPCHSDFDEFMSKVEKLATANFKIWINYVAYPPQLKQMGYYKKKVEEKNFHFVIQPFSGKYNGRVYPQDYSDAERNLIRNLVKGDKILEKNMEYQLDRKKVTGKLCYAGSRFAYILEDGTVKRCGESQSSVIGNFLDANFNLSNVPKPCNCQTCYCEFKWLVEEEINQGEKYFYASHDCNKNSTGVENNLIIEAEYYINKGSNINKAKECIRKILDNNPNNSQALRIFTEIYRKKADNIKSDSIRSEYLDLAQKRISKALGIRPGDPWINVEQSKLNIAQGKINEAELYLQKAIKQQPDNTYFRELRYELESKKNKDKPEENNLVNNTVLSEKFINNNENKILPEKVFWNWDIHYSCNYGCSYCFFYGMWDDIKKNNRYPGIKCWMETWQNIYKKYGECHVQISGGEPSTYPDFIKLIDGMSKIHTVEVTTNLSFNVREFSKYSDPGKVKVSSAFHPEFADFKTFLNKVVYLKEKGYIISVTCVGYPPHIKKLIDIKNKFEASNITFVLQPFRGEYEGRSYPDNYNKEEKNILKELTGDFVDNKDILSHHLSKTENNIGSGKYCRMGQMYGKIYPSGDVYRCCAEEIREKPPIGNIIMDKNFELFKNPEKCEAENCPCWKAMVLNNEKKWVKHWGNLF